MAATCVDAERNQPSWDLDFLDFPTAWYIADKGVVHTDRRCSYIQTFGALLCDCGAVEAEWRRRTRSRLVGPL
ncbi:hypothetical protein Q0Z83_060030 [Actinoplanes sichuanensis]|nr:hypothetical protein Q0Z83_060030 [Actinoplanes sichuanensis]